MAKPFPEKLRSVARNTAAIYLLIAGIWIVASDRVVTAITRDPDAIEKISTFKGWFFVSVTGILLYLGLRRQLRRLEREMAAHQRTSEALGESEQRFRTFADQASDAFFLHDEEGQLLDVNEHACAALGYTRGEFLALRVDDISADSNPETAKAMWKRTRLGDSMTLTDRHRRKDGSLIPVELSLGCFAAHGRRLFLAIARDVTERRAAELFAEGTRRILEMIATGSPLAGTLRELVVLLEAQAPEMRCSILLLDPDGVHLRHIAGPRLPAEYVSAIDGESIGPCAGSCGTAAYRRERVVVSDIATDPLWEDYRAAVLPHGLRACWSTPFFDSERRVLGTFAVYYDQPRGPEERHLRLVDSATHTAAICVNRHQAEAALRESEERFRAVVETAPDAIFIQTHGRLAYLNPMAARLFGVSDAGPLAGTPVLDHFLPEDRARIGERMQGSDANAAGVPVVEGRVLRGDRVVVDVQVSAVPFVHDGVRGALVFARDVTEQKRSIEQLRLHEAVLRETGEIARVGGWSFDVATGAGHWTAEVARIHDLDPGTPITREALLQYYQGESRARIEAALHDAVERATPYDLELELTTVTGRRIWVRTIGHPVIENGRVVRVRGAYQDITDRRRLEEQFRHAQKMQAIGTLAGGIAHDFNNILAAISGFAELARLDLRDRVGARECVDDILHATRRATGLVRQILAFSRKTQSERALIQLRPVLEESLRLLRATLPSTIEFRTDFGRDLGAVRADPTQVHQVIMNLGTNAWHAMSETGGVLAVQIQNFEVDASLAATEPRLRARQYVRISVRDSGLGMAREVLDRIFEPFFTTKAPGQGTGLGLSVVHGIMQEHEGAVTVYSTPGQGSAFHLYFPVADAIEAGVSSESAEAPRGRGQRILFVDDEEPLVRVGLGMLRELGYAPEGCSNAHEALERFRTSPDCYELLITDQTMPGMTGTEFVRRIRASRPNLRTILVTGYTGDVTEERARTAGASEVLQKPLTLVALGVAVHRVLLDGAGAASDATDDSPSRCVG